MQYVCGYVEPIAICETCKSRFDAPTEHPHFQADNAIGSNVGESSNRGTQDNPALITSY